MSKFLILLCNSAGELDRREADTEEDARDMAIELVTQTPFLADGDTIKVIEQ